MENNVEINCFEFEDFIKILGDTQAEDVPGEILFKNRIAQLEYVNKNLKKLNEDRERNIQDLGNENNHYRRQIQELTNKSKLMTERARRNPIQNHKLHDVVNSPKWYTKGGINTLDYIRAKNLNFSIGNAVKYLSRYQDKENPIQDLKKAVYYINDEIKRLELKENV